MMEKNGKIYAADVGVDAYAGVYREGMRIKNHNRGSLNFIFIFIQTLIFNN